MPGRREQFNSYNIDIESIVSPVQTEVSQTPSVQNGQHEGEVLIAEIQQAPVVVDLPTSGTFNPHGDRS